MVTPYHTIMSNEIIGSFAKEITQYGLPQTLSSSRGLSNIVQLIHMEEV